MLNLSNGVENTMSGHHAEGKVIACCSGKTPPEAKKVTRLLKQAGQWGGNAPKADCSAMLAVLPGESREVEPEPFSAPKEALMALTNVAIRVGSWTPAAVTGAATV